LRLHLSVLRSQAEHQLQCIAEAQRLWEANDTSRIVACLDAVLDANTAIRETCADVRMQGLNLTEAATK
jgi:hypothetical protein